jgi:hypothetical protein
MPPIQSPVPLWRLFDLLPPCPHPALVYRHSCPRVIHDSTQLLTTRWPREDSTTHHSRGSVTFDTKGAMYLLQEINVDNAIQARAAKNQMLLLYATVWCYRFIHASIVLTTDVY